MGVLVDLSKGFLAVFALIVLVKRGITMEEELTIRENREYMHVFELAEVRFAAVVYAQMIHETAGFKSDIFLKGNNMFGMKASSRKFHIGEYKKHAKYKTPADSLLDYKAWQDQMLKNHPEIDTDEEYIYFLQHLYKNKDGQWVGYAEDKNYEKRIKKYYNIIINKNI